MKLTMDDLICIASRLAKLEQEDQKLREDMAAIVSSAEMRMSKRVTNLETSIRSTRAMDSAFGSDPSAGIMR
jgi:hypothetical protein